MSAKVVHECIVPGGMDARAYQLDAVDHCLSGSTLLVLPTSMGKTPVEVMVMAERLRQGGKAIMLAPTNALVNQHLADLHALLRLPEGVESIVALTGSTPAKKREAIWAETRVVVATPQIVRNDVTRGVLDLADVRVLIVDEAHHATGNHAMAQVGDLYRESASDPLVLGATASPGHVDDDIHGVCDRLGLTRIHARAGNDPMLLPYAAGLEVEDVLVTVPQELRTLAKPLEVWMTRVVSRLRRLGYYTRSGHITMGGLNESRGRIQAAIGRQESIAYQAAKDNAVAQRLMHVINYLLCQGVAASREYLDRVERSGDRESASVKSFLAAPEIKSLHASLKEMDEIHSKVSMVRRMVRKQLRSDANSRTIVFANFRDTVDELAKALSEVEGARPIRFVGQASRDGSDGMSQKAQNESLTAFREGEANVLVATSVGEEGLDVPKADLVVFYEPVGSEIRTIQRRGRTGRHREGTVHVLIAQDTRDEGARASAIRREQMMHQAIQRVRRRRGAGPILAEGAMLAAFQVEIDGEAQDPLTWIHAERKRLAPELGEQRIDPTRPRIVQADGQAQPQRKDVRDGGKLSEKEVAKRIRPSGQVGLDAFPQSTGEERLIRQTPQAMLAAEDVIVEIAEPEPEASESIENDEAIPAIITADHREMNGALVARLRKMDLIVEIQALPVGDFRVGDRILVERKKARDFVDSLLDGRLLDQAARLAGAAPRTLLLVEGKDLFVHRSVHQNAIMGAMATLSLDFGLPVVTCADSEETARFLSVAAKREQAMLTDLTRAAQARLSSSRTRGGPTAARLERGDDLSEAPIAEQAEADALVAADAAIDELFEGRAQRDGRIVMDASAQAPLAAARDRQTGRISRSMLEQVPGIGPALATRILERFTTIAQIARAEDTELAAIPGLSTSTARELVRVLNGVGGDLSHR